MSILAHDRKLGDVIGPILSLGYYAIPSFRRWRAEGQTTNCRAHSGLTGAFPLRYWLVLQNFCAGYGHPAY